MSIKKVIKISIFVFLLFAGVGIFGTREVKADTYTGPHGQLWTVNINKSSYNQNELMTVSAETSNGICGNVSWSMGMYGAIDASGWPGYTFTIIPFGTPEATTYSTYANTQVLGSHSFDAFDIGRDIYYPFNPQTFINLQRLPFTVNPTLVTGVVDIGNGGTGTITSSPAGINCSLYFCSGVSFDYNSTVILTATPATGSTFTGWSSGCPGTGTCSILMDSSKIKIANFLGSVPTSYLQVIISGAGAGTVTSSPVGINCSGSVITCPPVGFPTNSTVVLTATPATGSTFTGWSSGTAGCSGTETCSVLMNTSKYTSANFGFAPVAPAIPTGLTAQAGATCGSGIIVQWNTSTGATSYTLQRDGSSIYTGSTNSFSDTGVTAGTTHTYSVLATNASGSSDYSSTVSGTAADACGNAGQCAPTHYNCYSATSSTNQASSPSQWTWTCDGTPPESCSERKSPIFTEP